jgi:hypothetical protein
MLSNVLLALTLIVATLVVLDFYLSDRHKTMISETTTRMWNWLDDVRRLSFLNPLRKRSVQWWIVIVAVALPTLVLVWITATVFSDRGMDFVVFLFYAIIVLFALFFIFLGPRLMTFTLAPDGTIQILLRVAVVFAAYIATVITLIIVVYAIIGPGQPMMYSIPENIFIFLPIIWCSSIYLLILFFIIGVPLLLVSFARAILHGLELTVRRIVEYPGANLGR